MIRPLLALALFPSLAAYAQSGAAEQPIETAGPVAIWVFVILFFGSIAVYVIMTLRGGKKAKDTKHGESKQGPKRAERA